MNIDIAAWYEKYGPMVIRRCRKILKSEEDALDAAQDVFTNLLRAKASIQSRNAEETYPSSLLYTMATNTCLNRLRKQKREILKDFSGEQAETIFIDEGFGQIEAEMVLETILKDESEMNRAICFMYHVDGMTLREIGEVVGLSIAGVRKRMESFINRLRLKLEDI
jgi:RNA polymerase sigma-70 factor (ECF subfamily)